MKKKSHVRYYQNLLHRYLVFKPKLTVLSTRDSDFLYPVCPLTFPKSPSTRFSKSSECSSCLTCCSASYLVHFSCCSICLSLVLALCFVHLSLGLVHLSLASASTAWSAFFCSSWTYLCCSSCTAYCCACCSS